MSDKYETACMCGGELQDKKMHGSLRRYSCQTCRRHWYLTIDLERPTVLGLELTAEGQPIGTWIELPLRKV